jgi:dipeptidyl aminopeptidase/acylaminoacyl peptidase
MRTRILPVPATLLLLLAGARIPLRAAEPAGEVFPVPDSIIAQGVPPIPLAGTEGLAPYENTRVANIVDWHPKERRLLIRTRFGETNQLHEVAMPMGARTQKTFMRERVTEGSYRPNDPAQIVFQLNEGGAENFQLFLLDTRTGRYKRFTDGKHRYMDPLWSRGGKLIAYTSNARNERDMDLYVTDPSAPGSERRVAELTGDWTVLEWSPDDRRILLSEYVSVNESYLHWADVASGQLHAITPRPSPGAPTVSYLDGAWSHDGKAVYTRSDQDSEVLRLVRIELDGGRRSVLSGEVPWDVEKLTLSDDGRILAFFVNEDGISRLRFVNPETGQALPPPELPAGEGDDLLFRPGSHEVGFSLSWARSPSDVYSYDVDAKRLDRWTASEAGGLNAESFAVPDLVRYPTFDTVSPGGAQRTIPAFVYRPAADRFPGKRPVYIYIHGGPEAQSRPNFLGSQNYVVDELGVVMIVPNVRGSTGYGKTYLKLDNGVLREDSVKDIGALLDWIAQQPGMDASRVMVAGGSYGGYMVLASMTLYGDRLCCAFDSVGISNFVTFLENTQEYRRDLRRAEYGDERDAKMRAFLESIAPANRADRLKRPLMVSQGANDPRVPLSESDQIVEKAKANGAPVWYLVGKDEGHGFQKKGNADYQRVVLFEFMRRHLLGEARAEAGR